MKRRRVERAVQEEERGEGWRKRRDEKKKKKRAKRERRGRVEKRRTSHKRIFAHFSHFNSLDEHPLSLASLVPFFKLSVVFFVLHSSSCHLTQRHTNRCWFSDSMASRTSLFSILFESKAKYFVRLGSVPRGCYFSMSRMLRTCGSKNDQKNNDKQRIVAKKMTNKQPMVRNKHPC